MSEFTIEEVSNINNMANSFNTLLVKVDESCIKVDESCVKVDESCVKVDESCIKVDESCIKVDESCIKVDESCIKVDESCIKVDESCVKVDESCVKVDESCVKIDESCIKVDESCIKVDESCVKVDELLNSLENNYNEIQKSFDVIVVNNSDNNLISSFNNIKLDNVKEIKPLSAKEKKKNLTSYWGVQLDNTLFDNLIIKQVLSDNKELIPLTKIHSTLLYVGKKEGNLDEEIIRPFENKKCLVTIDAFGSSEDALSMRVESIISDNIDIPSFATKQHITTALKQGIQAKDSVNTLLGCEGSKITFVHPKIVLEGIVKRYLF
jgi:hypothetical protein